MFLRVYTTVKMKFDTV